MSQFDLKAADWDKNEMHWERSRAVYNKIVETINLDPGMKAMEYGAGTGILSFLLKDSVSEITLMDNSSEMVKVVEEKIRANGITHFKPLYFNLESNDYNGTFDFIFTQMVLHHVEDVESILEKFYHLLNKGGHLAIADLHEEDGTFHDDSFTGHWGFNADELGKLLQSKGFNQVSHQTCFVLKKTFGDGSTKEFPIFLLHARK